MNKIFPLEALKDIGGILCHGGFDFCHLGHMRYFARAKSLLPGCPLIVTLTADEYFSRNKGPNRPAFPARIRAEWLSYVDNIDFVAIVHEPTALLAINTIKPRYYCKGREYETSPTADLNLERAAVESHGGQMVFIEDDGKQFSSSDILRELRHE